MKKYILFSIIVFASILFLFTDKVSGADEKTIYSSETSTPILYQDGSNTPVTVPVNYIPKKQELRGAWVATVYNIDITKQSGTTSSDIQDYKNNYLDILNNLEAYNMNAVIFQVRPTNDAFYQSSLNPWSKYLIGEQGKDPGWDPLAWMVEVTHQRGMEYHAWFNPYRISTSSVSDKAEYLEGLAPNNFARLNPDLVIKDANGKLIYNPGEPRVQQFIIDTVMEVAQNYDIDAIHFDDYFYPYAGVGSNDLTTYNTYNPSNLSLDDWRRENVDNVIKGINDALTIHNQTNNKAVQFGISPFGIWANKSHDPLGSYTHGSESYYGQFADTRKWVKEGWIDYIVPQLYWEFDKISYKDDGTQVPVAPYADLVNWWVDVVKDTNVNLYIGHGIYKYSTSDNWCNPEEIPNQLLYNQKFDEVKGSIYFSYSELVESNAPSSLDEGRNIIKSYYNQNDVVILPAQKNIDSTIPLAPTNFNISSTSTTMELSWDNNNDAKLYVVYRFNEGEEVDISDSSKILNIIYPKTEDIVFFTDSDIVSNTTYKYAVTAIDNAYNESEIIGGASVPLKPSINNTNNFILEVNTLNPNWLEGVSAEDCLGIDLTSEIVVDDSNVLLDTIGTYELTYSVTDSNSNIETVTVQVIIEDTIEPTITLNGDNEITLEVKSIYEELGAILSDNYDTSLDLVIEGTVNTNELGEYILIYYTVDSNDNKSEELTRTVNIVDTKKPTITLNGDSQITLEVKSIYQELSATLSDNYDTTLDLVIEGRVYTNYVGQYVLTYYTIDDSGNKSEELTRTVNVVDTKKPTITLNGDSEITIEVNTTYDELGATLSDNYDKSLDLTIEGLVNINEVGRYILTYYTVDSSENKSEELTRIVNVVDTTPPTINGVRKEVIINNGDTFDPLEGITVTDNYDTNLDIKYSKYYDVNVSGEYVITLIVSDSSGNKTYDYYTLTVNGSVYKINISYNLDIAFNYYKNEVIVNEKTTNRRRNRNVI